MLRGLLMRQMFLVLDVLLVGVVAVVSGFAVMKGCSPQDNTVQALTAPETAPETEQVFAKVGPRAQYEFIINSGLFGEAAKRTAEFKPPEPKEPEPQDDIDTTLPLVLKGTVVAGAPDILATALIEVKEGAQTVRTFYHGDEVVDNVFVKEIRNKEVVLDNRRTNRTEYLRQNEDPKRFAVAAQNYPQPTQRTNLTQPQQPAGGNMIEIDHASIVQQLSDDYETIATQVDVRVAEDEQGNVIGLTADNVEGIPTADTLGLQNNDILTSINNQPVDSVEAVVDILNKYRNAQTFRLNILRNGQRQTLTYALK